MPVNCHMASRISSALCPQNVHAVSIDQSRCIIYTAYTQQFVNLVNGYIRTQAKQKKILNDSQVTNRSHKDDQWFPSRQLRSQKGRVPTICYNHVRKERVKASRLPICKFCGKHKLLVTCTVFGLQISFTTMFTFLFKIYTMLLLQYSVQPSQRA